ncbi:MAG TPA: phospho-N-acetylmuramoyl-pentapeptide-transferase, partial [Chitinophagaceae bacterium]|nr:phospho-N-acetylmuramoyl-pentapeptide-transferase [Chitinophagaceae bacterium]
MLYHFFDWLNEEGIRFPGSRVFDYITFRTLMAILLSLFITLVYGKKLITFLQKRQIGESIREEGLA